MGEKGQAGRRPLRGKKPIRQAKTLRLSYAASCEGNRRKSERGGIEGDALYQVWRRENLGGQKAQESSGPTLCEERRVKIGRGFLVGIKPPKHPRWVVKAFPRSARVERGCREVTLTNQEEKSSEGRNPRVLKAERGFQGCGVSSLVERVNKP